MPQSLLFHLQWRGARGGRFSEWVTVCMTASIHLQGLHGRLGLREPHETIPAAADDTTIVSSGERETSKGHAIAKAERDDQGIGVALPLVVRMDDDARHLAVCGEDVLDGVVGERLLEEHVDLDLGRQARAERESGEGDRPPRGIEPRGTGGEEGPAKKAGVCQCAPSSTGPNSAETKRLGRHRGAAPPCCPSRPWRGRRRPIRGGQRPRAAEYRRPQGTACSRSPPPPLLASLWCLSPRGTSSAQTESSGCC